LVQRLLDECLTRSSFAARLAERMLNETGTRLIDWIDHFSLPASDSVLSQLSGVGYVRGADGQCWEHPKGLFPRIRAHAASNRDLAIKVESVVDFVAAQRLSSAEIDGAPMASVRVARVASANDVRVLAVERHGDLAFDANRHEKPPCEPIV